MDLINNLNLSSLDPDSLSDDPNGEVEPDEAADQLTDQARQNRDWFSFSFVCVA